MWVQIKNNWFNLDRVGHIYFNKEQKTMYFWRRELASRIDFSNEEEFNKAKAFIENKLNQRSEAKI